MLVTVLILDKIQQLGPVRGGSIEGNAWFGPQGLISWILDFATSRQKYVTGCHPLAALHSLLNFESTIQEGEPALSIPDLSKAMGFVGWITASYQRMVCNGSVNTDASELNPKIEYLNGLLKDVPVSTPRATETTDRVLTCGGPSLI
jgi:hypothetical protein